jgi:hypothetical protein
MIRQLSKSSLVIIVLLAISISSFAQNPFSSFNDAKPKGKIDTVIITGNGDGKYVYIYNKHQQLVETTWYREEVIPDGFGRFFDTVKTIFTYSENRHLISSTTIFKGGKKSTATYKYILTKHGYAIRTSDTFSKDSLIVYEMRFDHSGRIIESGYYALNDLEKQRAGNFGYKYNTKGNLVKSTAYYNLIKPYELFYTYDNNDDMIVKSRDSAYATKVAILHIAPGQTFKYSYTRYDNMHNWVEMNKYRFDIEEIEDDFVGKVERRITYYK